MSHTPPTQTTWPHDDPRYDRAAGTWLGAAYATHIVASAPTVLTDLAHPHSQRRGPARISWLGETALRDISTPGTITAHLRTEAERALAHTLREAVVTGTLPHAAATQNDDVVAWAVHAAVATPVPDLDAAQGVFPCSQLETAVRAAHTAAGEEAALVAGALAGARWGASAVPLSAHREISTSVAPGPMMRRCVVLARGSDHTIWPQQEHHYQDRGGCAERRPFSTPHPFDPGVVLGNFAHMREEDHTEGVVSLCRLGTADVPARLPVNDRVEVALIDTDGANPNLHFIIDEAARVVAALRGEGKQVLLHCAAGQSRTPAVAAHYAALACDVDPVSALRTIITAVGGHLDTPELSRAVAALHGVHLAHPVRDLFPRGLPPRRDTPQAATKRRQDSETPPKT